jgi:hypothetical protein
MENYTRINGNNADPKFTGYMQPTNADKYVRATGVVPQGLPSDPPREFLTNEVYADWQMVLRGITSTTTSASMQSEQI